MALGKYVVDYEMRVDYDRLRVYINVDGASYQGYKSCIYRTFCCGKATQEQKDINVHRNFLTDQGGGE
jgi:hypothetical protein